MATAAAAAAVAAALAPPHPLTAAEAPHPKLPDAVDSTHMAGLVEQGPNAIFDSSVASAEARTTADGPS